MRSLVAMEEELPEFKKTSVFFTVFMSIITLGIYMPYWFLSRRKVINELDSEKKVPFELPLLVFILYIFSEIVNFTMYLEILSVGMMELLEGIYAYISLFGIVCLIFLSFRAKAILEANDSGVKYSGLATFFFTIWYLQYRINKGYIE